MTRKFILAIILLLSLQPVSVYAHTEIVCHVIFENFKNELYAKFILDKRQLAMALMQEADCIPKEMLRVCGNEYVKNNIELKVNGKHTTYSQEWMKIQKNQVVMYYTVKNENVPISEIAVTSSYLFNYNEHAIMRINFDLKDYVRSFDIDTSRKQITASII